MKDLSTYINRTGLLTIRHKQGKLTVPVRVAEARKVSWRIDLRVTMLGGSGQVWASKQNVKLDKL